MKALELIGEIDEQRHLNTVLPQDAVPGPVRVIVLMPEAAGRRQAAATARLILLHQKLRHQTQQWLRTGKSSGS